MADRASRKRVSRELAGQGKLIAAGWVGLQLMAIPPDTPPAQLGDMRDYFFAGAAHLFALITSDPDAGSVLSASDQERLSLIQTELDPFVADFKLRHLPAKGSS